MASQNIVFETVPSSIRVPGRYIEFNTKLAVRNLPVNPQRVIIVAPMLDGSQQALVPVNVFSDLEAGEMFGFGSSAHLMARQAIRNNRYIDLSIIGLKDDAAAIKAAAEISITGTITQTGQIVATIGLDQYKIAVQTADDLEDTAARLALVINADPDCLAVATSAATTLTLIAKNAGEIGNEIFVDCAIFAQGISASTIKMANGMGNADVATALALIAGKHYHIYISAFADIANLQKFSEHIEHVSNAIEQRGGVVVAGHRGTLSTATAITKMLNNGRMQLIWYNGAKASNALIAAGYAAVMAFEEDPARPLNTLEIKGLDLTNENVWPLFSEQQNALYNGQTPLTIVNNKVQILRAISTYTKNATGTDDPALLDITTIRTLDYLRMAVNQRIALRFPREKLSDKTAPKVRSEILDVLMKMEELEILEQVEQNKAGLIVERDLQDVNRLNAAIPADVVNGLHVFAGRIDLLL